MDATANFIAPPSRAPGDGSVTVEFDRLDEPSWSALLSRFADATVYQTWPYAAGADGGIKVNRIVIKRDGEVTAAASASIRRLRPLRAGMAYVFWGPLWQPAHSPADLRNLREALRALRVEYVLRRGLALQIVPPIAELDNAPYREIFEDEGFTVQGRTPPRRTILLDLRPSLDQLQQGLHQKWRYHLNKARKRNFEIVEGEDDALFEQFARIYAEMAARKRLGDLADLDRYRKLQRRLPAGEKMRVFLCRAENEICSGSIVSALGGTGIYLYGATSNRGVKNYSSYLMHWRMLQWVKEQGCTSYDLNGINPEKNPGGFQFKTQLGGTHGRDVSCLGYYGAYPNQFLKWISALGEMVRAKLPNGRAYLRRVLR